jgi:hypothetical protein
MRLAKRSSMRVSVVSIILSQGWQFDDCASLRWMWTPKQARRRRDRTPRLACPRQPTLTGNA